MKTAQEPENTYYAWLRTDAIRLLQSHIKNRHSFNHILEIGCGNGETAAKINEIFKPQTYSAIEQNPKAAAAATKHLDHVIQADFEQMIKENDWHGIMDVSYDMIVLLDILEHLKDPWKAIKILSACLSDNGVILGSIPNAGHYYVIKRLIRDRLVYEDRGLLDKTHLHFFTLFTVKEMLNEAGLILETLDANTDLFVPKIKLFNIITCGLFKKQFIRQYVFIAGKHHVR